MGMGKKGKLTELLKIKLQLILSIAPILLVKERPWGRHRIKGPV